MKAYCSYRKKWIRFWNLYCYYAQIFNLQYIFNLLLLSCFMCHIIFALGTFTKDFQDLSWEVALLFSLCYQLESEYVRMPQLCSCMGLLIACEGDQLARAYTVQYDSLKTVNGAFPLIKYTWLHKKRKTGDVAAPIRFISGINSATFFIYISQEASC